MNIFNGLGVYASKWSEKASRNFNAEEINLINSAHVVSSQYGLSVCFMLKTGGSTYLTLDVNSTLVEGEVVDLANAKLITLEKIGKSDIIRVKA